jgi:aryl-alcohol dehydrogenase-like predicted oxidoreductase
MNPTLHFGAMPFGQTVDLPQATRMVALCLDNWVTTFDTAHTYGDGRSEIILGQALRQVDTDSVATIATKFGGGTTASGSLGSAELLTAIDGSLARLATDRLDIVYLHRPDRATPIEATASALKRAYDAGKVGRVGVSNFSGWRLLEAHKALQSVGLPGVETSQVMYNPLARRIEGEYLDLVTYLDVSTVAYNPLAGGLLTGKYASTIQEPDAGRYSAKSYRERYWNPPMFDVVANLERIAHRGGLSLIELTFAWLTAMTGVDSILVGASDEVQLSQNLAAAATPALDPETINLCDEASRVLLGAAPSYYR